ncbi:dephospho-CoA kinase [Salisediminibacterium selenitireducens]|uniref:Dephospho-CoA kinase n=1 Tax=Bacillus selenitireducens (strain ATCC 700615 / DSM 15326 / MLS10) TaxID=439292 RepID=D6XST7_BACIE|nr:dephospho-CoA kinase [Salisediminibacterium selenitireducens]ADH98873.1 dephospho-CoA kinase [[Bacillus] selenitireducens MLS10]
MIIGLTGGIGTGKSTVSKMMRGFDWVVVDADVIARQVVEPHEPAFEAIVEAFGDDIVSEETGTINREKLGRIVFDDEEKRERLNSIVHPAVREAMKAEAEEAKDYGAEVVVMDIPLLIESDLFHMVERTVLVYAPEEQQIERVMERNGLTEDEVRARLRAQLPIEEKKQRVDDVIDNSGSLEELEAEVSAYVETIHNLLA